MGQEYRRRTIRYACEYCRGLEVTDEGVRVYTNACLTLPRDCPAKLNDPKESELVEVVE
jgi:hypothetical protein